MCLYHPLQVPGSLGWVTRKQHLSQKSQCTGSLSYLPWLSRKLQGEGRANLNYANTLTWEAGLRTSQHS